MNCKSCIFRIAILLLLPATVAMAQPERRDARSDSLLERYAPILHHAVDHQGDHSLDGRSDQLAAFDFDGDWIARNNWEHLETHPVTPVVYTSHVETETHHYLLYAFFHPRDWTNRWFSPTLLDSEHENDCEAFLCVVAKHDGEIVAGLSVFHDELHVLLPAGSLDRARKRSDQRLLRLSEHAGGRRPILFQEARGHGLTSWPNGLQPGPRIVYYPCAAPERSITAQRSLTPSRFEMAPVTGSAGHVDNSSPATDGASFENLRYELVSMFAPGGFWSHRNDPDTFAALGRISGDDAGGCGEGFRACQHDRAHAPWGMELAGLDAGAIALDPVRLIKAAVVQPAGASVSFDSAYLANPYLAAR